MKDCDLGIEWGRITTCNSLEFVTSKESKQITKLRYALNIDFEK